jgi:hypothetical protein
MADSMEGVVATVDEPKTEEKAIEGKSFTSTTHHAVYLEMSLRRLHDFMAGSQDVSESHDRDGPGVLQVSVSAG